MTPVAMVHREPAASEAERCWTTAKGPVCIKSHADAASIMGLEMDTGIGVFHHYGVEAAERQKDVLLRVAAMRDGNAVIAYTPSGRIVGYICLSAPGADERWGGAGFEFVHEFGLLEVSRDWRGVGMAEKLMAVAFDDDALEDKIVVSNSYAWHWDLEQSGLSKWQYRGRLHRLLARHGLVELATDEENICFDPANLLTARFGSRVPPDRVARFNGTLFRGEREIGRDW